MNLPMSELEALIKDTGKLTKLMLNHVVNRSLYSNGFRAHQVVKMAGGGKLNVFRRKGDFNARTTISTKLFS